MKKLVFLIFLMAPIQAMAGASWSTAVADGPYSVYRSTNVGTTGVVAKSRPGVVKGWQATNVGAAARFIKLYDRSVAPTIGTHTPLMTIAIPSGTATIGDFGYGIWFSSGISVGATTGLADTDTGAPTAGDVILNLFYK
jgi:hypothetical protein